jgi:hypothetical protein
MSFLNEENMIPVFLIVPYNHTLAKNIGDNYMRTTKAGIYSVIINKWKVHTIKHISYNFKTMVPKT